MKKLALALSLLATAVSLVACGGGGDDTPTNTVATSNVTSNITASTVGAVSGQSFSFASGVSQFGTNSATTLNFPSASTFAVSSAQGTASGNLGFGSCIFTVGTTTYTSGPLSLVGTRIEISPCSLTATTAGTSVQAGPAAAPVTFTLGVAISAVQNFLVDIAADGTVTVNGTNVGAVTTAPATGATGASGG